MAKKQKLKIIPLGGLGEIGKNITVFEKVLPDVTTANPSE